MASTTSKTSKQERLKRRLMSEIIERFMRDAGRDNPVFFDDDHLEGIAQRLRRDNWRGTGNDELLSYGHFPLAEIIPAARKRKHDQGRGWWLLNGDIWHGATGWGVSTSGQQREVLRHAHASGLPVLIVPFSAIDAAGIVHNSIRMVEVREDSYEWEHAERDNPPSEWERNDDSWQRNWELLPSGRWSYEHKVHHLGESLFRARYRYTERVRPARHDYSSGQREYVPGEDRVVDSTAYFLSAYDRNEPGTGLYFLAQLPKGARPRTVAEAREALKPQEVLAAEADGVPVLRQGDVFAVQTEMSTRFLPGPSKKNERVLNVNHTASEVRYWAGMTFGRGVLRHAPGAWRRPEHRNVKLGNGRDWYLLVKNTVPMGRSASINDPRSRAWTVAGRVD